MGAIKGAGMSIIKKCADGVWFIRIPLTDLIESQKQADRRNRSGRKKQRQWHKCAGFRNYITTETKQKTLKIEVDGRFTYICSEKVEIGDTVILPAPWWKPAGELHTGQVTSLTSDYNGGCVEIIRVIPARKAPA